MYKFLSVLMLQVVNDISSSGVNDECLESEEVVADFVKAFPDYCNVPADHFNVPAGWFPYKNPTNVTVNDFVFSGLGVAGNTSNTMYNSAVTPAIDTKFAGLNGLGILMASLDIGVGGVIPLRTHRVSKVIIAIDGTIIAGFIASDNTAYFKKLNKSDMMIFPQSLLHFQVNVGEIPALAFVSLASAHLGFMFTSSSLGSNDLPNEIIEKITLLDAQQVKVLKNIFGGSN
ncbi:auxin-binding protein ABP20-like [Silene latifolia]|uniref:auxin-binding protein ABP20-like n=1 Tax=Silene latifolia TaxID=37657 RepID=UPI003D77B49B